MEQYTKKSEIVAEIDSLQDATMDENRNFLSSYHEGIFDGLSYIENFLDTIEVKEEILDKEGKAKLMKKCVHKAYKRGYDMGVLQTTNKINHNIKEVDLEKEVDSQTDLLCNLLCYMDELSNGDSEGVYPLPENVIEDLRRFAKHFYELGLKAQKGD